MSKRRKPVSSGAEPFSAFAQRLKLIVGTQRGAIAKFARRIAPSDIKNQKAWDSLIRAYLTGMTRPGADKVAEIASTAGVASDWLMLGNGPMDKASEFYEGRSPPSTQPELQVTWTIADEILKDAKALLQLGEYIGAIDKLKKCLRTGEILGQSWVENQLYCINNLGRCHYLLARGVDENLNLAQDYYETSLSLATQIADKNMICESHVNLGNCELRRGHFIEAEKLFKQAEAEADDLNSQVNKRHVLQGLGTLAAAIGDLDMSLQCYLACVDVKDDSLDKRFAEKYYALWNNIGFTYLHLGDYERASYYLQKVLKYTNSLKDNYVKAFVLENLGLNEELNGNLEKAQYYYQESLEAHRLPGALIQLSGLLSGEPAQLLAKEGMEMLINQPFEAVLDQSFSWNTLIQVLGNSVIPYARKWINKITECLRSDQKFWQTPSRSKLLKLIGGQST
ncbi:tetratricopeptide repeat protein [Anthocerotibacter panamensis]|uniref:tetratricopeptide repeat protein n=1 Tax=Anthocerotibacter panamensis TaxID=2857077 RepID=UPI001C40244F|nr:tetratricopeptide repeat protein [Anthocerotibacter panamensis]